MAKRLLIEKENPFPFISTKKPVLVEDVKTPGQMNLVVEGIFGKLDSKNENNRLYPGAEFERNLKEGSSFQSRMARRGVIGELEHPESGNTHLERGSHLVTAAWIETLNESRIKELGYDPADVKPGKYVLGNMEVLPTPKGKILRVYFENKVDIGVSSRGRGDTTMEDGVEHVYDYDLDTWDVVYLPSVTEARPKVVREQAEPLGVDVGGKEDFGAVETPGTPAPDMGATTTGAWKGTAEALMRSMQDVASQAEPDKEEMIGLISQATDVMDMIAVLQEPEAIKLKTQILALNQVITARVMSQEVGKDVVGTVVKDTGKKDKKSKSKKEKEESIVEQDMKTLAQTTVDYRKKEGKEGTVYKGEIESILKKSGHEPTLDNVTRLSAEFRAAGLDVDEEKYESLHEAEKEYIHDGECVTIKLDVLKNIGIPHPEVVGWLESKEEPVMAQVISRGTLGYVVHFFESPASDYDVFVPFEKVKKLEIKERVEDKEIDDMGVKCLELVDKLTVENAKLKQQLAESVSRKKYEAAKKLAGALVERTKKAEKRAIEESRKSAASVKLLRKMAKQHGVVVEKGKSDEEGKRTITEGKREVPGRKSSQRYRITEGSKDLRRRIKSSIPEKTDDKRKPVRESSNLMSATSRRLAG